MVAATTPPAAARRSGVVCVGARCQAQEHCCVPVANCVAPYLLVRYLSFEDEGMHVSAKEIATHAKGPGRFAKPRTGCAAASRRSFDNRACRR